MGSLTYLLSYLYAKVAPIDVVAEEQVFGGGRRAAHLEQLHQIVELAVDVAANWWINQNEMDTKRNNDQRSNQPVTGASMSIIVFSLRSSVAPSWMMRTAAASSMRPSSMKCCLRTSGKGLPLPRRSNTSATVSLWLGGNRTPAGKGQTDGGWNGLVVVAGNKHYNQFECSKKKVNR